MKHTTYLLTISIICLFGSIKTSELSQSDIEKLTIAYQTSMQYETLTEIRKNLSSEQKETESLDNTALIHGLGHMAYVLIKHKRPDLHPLVVLCQHNEYIKEEDKAASILDSFVSRDKNNTEILSQALEWAVTKNNEFVVKKLLQAGANPNWKRSFNNESILLVACKRENSANLAIVQLLLDHKADQSLDVQNIYEESPVTVAQSKQDIKLKALLSKYKR